MTSVCFYCFYSDEFLFDDIGSYTFLSNGNVEVAGIDDRSDLKDTLVSDYNIQWWELAQKCDGTKWTIPAID